MRIKRDALWAGLRHVHVQRQLDGPNIQLLHQQPGVSTWKLDGHLQAAQQYEGTSTEKLFEAIAMSS